MNPETYQEVKKFAEGLKTCYNSRKKEYSNSDETVDKGIVAALNYATDIIDTHLMILEFKVEKFANDMAVHYEVKK